MAARCIDVEGSSSQHFPNWDAAYAHYSAHYCQGCVHILLHSSAQSSASPHCSTTPNSITNTTNPRKKNLKIVESKPATASSATSKHHCRQHHSSSSAAGNYHSLYDDDDPGSSSYCKPCPSSRCHPSHLCRSIFSRYCYKPYWGGQQLPHSRWQSKNPKASQQTSRPRICWLISNHSYSCNCATHLYN